MPKANMLLADGVNSNPAKRLGQPDQHAAEQRAGHRAQPPVTTMTKASSV